MRTIPDLPQYLAPLDKIINERWLPALFGCQITPLERSVIALPAKLGGLGIPVLQELAEEEFVISIKATLELVEKMRGAPLMQDPDQNTLSDMIAQRKQKHDEEYKSHVQAADEHFARLINQAREPGASNWLTSLPLRCYGFTMNKDEFRDSLRLRYGK